MVPDIASFAVDDGFAYGVPEGLDVDVGDRVRIRVSGRRLRGYVTARISEPPTRTLAPVDGVVGTLPSFGERELPLLRWAATHYVSPLSIILKRTTPPNVPRGQAAETTTGPRETTHSVRSRASRAPHLTAVAAEVASVPDASSVMIIVPTTGEAASMAASLSAQQARPVVFASSDLSDREVTASWVAAATQPGTVLVGTREIALWPVNGLARIIVVEDSRRVMKSPSTPTIGVREVASERARTAEIPITFISPLPSLEVLSTATERLDPAGRLWSLVEVMDRREEPPGVGPVFERTTAAIAATATGGGTAFVLVPRRRYAGAYRCRRCGTLRRCAVCGSGVEPGAACARCGAEAGPCVSCGNDSWYGIGAGVGSVVDAISRRLGGDVGTAGDGRPVTVGTERDLLTTEPVSLAVAVDVDRLTLAPNYRASEDALRLLARLGQLVVRGRGHRCIVQTADPTQPVIEAFRSGRYEDFQRAERMTRMSAQLPPGGQLIAIETSGASEDLQDPILDLGGGAQVLGPAPVGDRIRWLVQGKDLTAARVGLRQIVGRLRDAGARVRVDVDPIDL